MFSAADAASAMRLLPFALLYAAASIGAPAMPYAELFRWLYR